MKPINSRLGLSIALFALFPLVAIGEANAAYDRQGTAADVRPADLQITAGVQAPPHRSFDPNAMQTIMTQDFEGAFPAAGWSVYDGTLSDGKENYWDDDDYRSAGGSWAAWPANGGADGLDPQSSTYPYFANAWMTYGPFDLSNAQSANVNFMLWLATEANYDFLFFGSSGTGSSYVGSSWSGNADWDQKTISLNQHVGDNSVWIAWRFTSDSSRNYEGPWVDDIVLSFEPRDITIDGQLTYADRAAVMRGGNAVKAQLWDWDGTGSDLLAEAIADANGVVNFPTRANWDADDTDPILGNRRLDPYIRWVAENNDSRVTSLSGTPYAWTTPPSHNVSNSSILLSTNLSASDASRGALWLFEDIQRARAYYLNQTFPQTSPGFISTRWEDQQNSHFPCNNSSCYYAPGQYAFIKHASIDSADTVVHEIGHHIMHNLTGQWHVESNCFDHEIFSSESASCAWSEGWGDFYALIANGDKCYDFDLGPCTGTSDVDHYDLENHNRSDSAQPFDWGDGVEGRVAGALYDLLDASNEAPWYDNAAWGFDAIADVAMGGQGQPTLQDFWNAYQGAEKHNGVRSIYQNTIDYDQAPVWSAIPDKSLLQNFTFAHFLDLWDYTSDTESPDGSLTYQLVSVSDSRCVVTRDSHWLNATPQTGWVGSCLVTVRANDSLKSTDSSFWLHILPINSRMFLPMFMR